jgi:hypothetical protein
MLAENLPIIWPNEKTVKLQVFASIEGSHGHPLSKFTLKYKPVKRVYQTFEVGVFHLLPLVLTSMSEKL